MAKLTNSCPSTVNRTWREKRISKKKKKSEGRKLILEIEYSKLAESFFTSFITGEKIS